LNVDLASPTYITDDWLECHKPPNYKVCAGDIMRSDFVLYYPHHEANGALIYSLQRNQSRKSIELGKDTSRTVHLLVVWEISEYEGLHSDVLFIKHDKGSDWNKDDLRELCYDNINQLCLFSDSVTETWSIDDNIVLMTTFKVMYEDRILNIIISETEIDNSTRMPVLIDPERWVVPEMMIIVTMLIYAVSLKFQLSVCLTIHNQCSNTKLVSPVYFGDGVVGPKSSNQQMDIDTKMEASFEIDTIQDKFEGALLYELWRYSGRHHKGILTAKAVAKLTRIHMLVIWDMNYSMPSSYIVLLKNIRGFKWNEDKLKKLYDKNYARLKRYDDTTLYTWLIDDETVLTAIPEVRCLKRTTELNISIYEGKRYSYTTRPLWINEKR
jgi:hypothetical protein